MKFSYYRARQLLTHLSPFLVLDGIVLYQWKMLYSANSKSVAAITIDPIPMQVLYAAGLNIQINANAKFRMSPFPPSCGVGALIYRATGLAEWRPEGGISVLHKHKII